LLGLQWGQFPERWELSAKPALIKSEAALITEGEYVRGFSGMSCVVPATDIINLLDHPDLKGPRDDADGLHPEIPVPE
jgi:hypothetical protein